MAISQTLLLNNLERNVPRLLPQISAEAVIRAGALNLRLLTDNAQVLRTLRIAWAGAIRDVLILALAAAIAAFPLSCWIEPLNIKEVAERRKAEGKQSAGFTDSELLESL